MTDINNLAMKRILLDWLIRDLRNSDDPRASAAINELQYQQRAINEMIAEQMDNEKEPTIVGLKSIKMSARAPGG